MNDVAIRVEGLGKSYRLRKLAVGGAVGYRTLRDEVMQLPTRLLGALGRTTRDEEEFWALKDVSFEVKRGEVLGVIGRNGAGKSTLLKILSRIVEPTEGAVDIYGRVGSLLEVGTGFHPELTGRENIFLSGAILGMRRHEVRVRLDEIVAFAGVEAFLDTPCKHYSSGMYARLGFAVAAHLRAEILIVDEVLAVGDLDFQRRCFGAMQRVAADGRTVLLVSHELAVVSALSSRCLWLGGGKTMGIGATGTILGDYLSSIPVRSSGVLTRENQADKPAMIVEFKAGNESGGALIAGGAAYFDIRLKLREPRRDLLMGIGIDSEFGARQATLYSHFTADKFDLPSGYSQLRCQVERLPLRPGRYLISLHLAVASETMDHLDHAFVIEVMTGDFFGTGRLPTGTQGMILVDQSWKLVQGSRPWR